LACQRFGKLASGTVLASSRLPPAAESRYHLVTDRGLQLPYGARVQNIKYSM